MREQSAQTAVADNARAGDAAACEQYLGALFGDAPHGAHIELRHRSHAGMGRAFFPVHAVAEATAEIAHHASRTDVYVGVLPRARQASRRSDLVGSGGVLWVDCDTPESADALAVFVPEPSVVVASGTGSNRHAYWLLKELVSIDTIEAANRRLAELLGADVSCAEANRVLRPPSRNWKTLPPANVSLRRCASGARYRLGDLMADTGAAPVTGPVHPRPRRVPDDGSDPLLHIEPAVYVEVLTGIRVPPDGKFACPFHDDSTPSLHVYSTPARGWYCYGCGRGGSVFDFAAALWSVEPRGSAFVELRRRLRAALLA
jgi:hypothetical protein